MNRSLSSKFICYISLILIATWFKPALSTTAELNTVNDVKLLEVGLAKTVHCVGHLQKAILQCKPKHVLIVHTAQWSNATCEQKKELENPPKEKTQPKQDTYRYFDRTEALQHLCDGLNTCFLYPSKARHDTSQVTFLGDPIAYHLLSTSSTTTDNYSLTVSVSCLNRDLSVRGRRVTDTIESKENPVDFGCNDGEVIHLATTRVDAYAENGPNRSLTQYNFGPHVFDCNLKQKCQITAETLKKCEGDPKHLVFGTAVLVYYCRKPMTFAFCDRVKKTTGTTEASTGQTELSQFEHVLYAEQDSQVTVKAKPFSVLKVETAFWSTSDKLNDATFRKDRKDLLEFLCNDRNFCAFTPKRSAAGALESSFEEVHFGGIVNVDKPLVLLARFSTKHIKELTENSPKGLKTVTVQLKDKISLKCDANDEGTIHVLSAMAGPTEKTDLKGASDEMDPDSVRFKDLTRVLHKICYRKRECHWSLNPVVVVEGVSTSAGGGGTGTPAALQVASLLETGSGKTESPKPGADSLGQARQQPLPAGIEGQEITIKYLCKKYTHDPSLVDVKTTPGSMLQMSDSPTAHVSVADKEQAEEVQLVKDKKMFINLEVYGDCTVHVGELFTIKVPDLNGGNVEAFFAGKESTNKFTHSVSGQFTKYVFYLGFGQNSLDFALDASGGTKDQHHSGKVENGNDVTYPVKLKDVVKATGKIVGMRVYLSK